MEVSWLKKKNGWGSIKKKEGNKFYFLLCFVVDLKSLYSKVGVEGKPTVFLFNDTQVAEESFLEDINNVLSSGEVPNLYKPEEFEEVSSDDVSFLFSLSLSWLLIKLLKSFTFVILYLIRSEFLWQNCLFICYSLWGSIKHATFFEQLSQNNG